MWNDLFLIPPNDGNHRVTSCFTLPKHVIALAFTAHMHFRGKSMMTEAIYPDGRHEVIMDVPHYDFRWQETDFLKRPCVMPKATKLVTTAYFDNSSNNPQNPDPSKALRWGEPSDEEMMGFWLQFADPQPVTEKSAVAKR
jgi:Copper type II ascorbate-dependent monooxygenase, C-terminal domain